MVENIIVGLYNIVESHLGQKLYFRPGYIVAGVIVYGAYVSNEKRIVGHSYSSHYVRWLEQYYPAYVIIDDIIWVGNSFFCQYI